MFPLLFLTLASSSAFAQTAGKLLPLAPPYGEMPPTFWEQNGTMILIGGIILIVLIAVVLWKILQPRPAVVLLPEVLAREALEKLAEQPEDGRVLSQASQILRQYVIAVFELSPVEMTTSEFCRALASSEKVGSELAQSFSSFLHECDERKFAPATPSSPFNAITRALELVSQAEIRRAKMREQTTVSA